MMNWGDFPIFDIDRGHMRFATCTKEDSDDILFLFQCSENEAEVGARLTQEERAEEKTENVFGIVIHGQDCAKVIGEVISNAYGYIEQMKKEVKEHDFTETDD